MPLPAQWVDHLIGKLSVRYGAAFMRQYADAAPELVKADWAEVLDGFSKEALQYGLRYLPATPPNALQFRDQCRRAPREERPQLTHDTLPPNPGRVAALLTLAERARGEEDPMAWVHRLRLRKASGEAMSIAQADALKRMEHVQ